MTAPLPGNADARPRRWLRQVLYIEDDEVSILLMQALINTRPGWQLDVERTATAGLARLRTARPDVLLLDLQLPDMTGLQLRALLQADPALAALPCILLTADARQSTQQQARQMGFFCVHHKPMQLQALLAELQRACASTAGA